jgi:hypothetical protein
MNIWMHTRMHTATTTTTTATATTTTAARTLTTHAHAAHGFKLPCPAGVTSWSLLLKWVLNGSPPPSQHVPPVFPLAASAKMAAMGAQPADDLPSAQLHSAN